MRVKQVAKLIAANEGYGKSGPVYEWVCVDGFGVGLGIWFRAFCLSGALGMGM